MSHHPVARFLAAACAATALAGCSWSASLKAREATVYFQNGVSAEQRSAARAACLNVPHTSPEPIATDAVSVRAHTDIRFRVDDANDNELAQLYKCLEVQPGYRTVEMRELGISNNG